MKNNKLIAEFMGFKKLPNGTLRCSELYGGNTICEDDTVLFQTSWDWLIPVVEKISHLETVQCFNIESSRILIKTYESYKLEFWVNGFEKIEAVYESVLDFIKWYNKQPAQIGFDENGDNSITR